jgi:hypothetical protein
MTTLRPTLIGTSLLVLSAAAHAQSNNQSARLFELCFQAGRLGNAICDKQADPGERLHCLEIVRAEQFECVQRMLPEEAAIAPKAVEPPTGGARNPVPSAPPEPSIATAPNAGASTASSQADSESASPGSALPSTQTADGVGSIDNGLLLDKSVELDQPTASPAASQSLEPAQPIEKIEPTTPTVGATLPAQDSAPMYSARPALADEPAITEKVDPPNDTVNTDSVNAKAEETKWVVSETTSPVDYSPLISATIRPRQRINSGLSGLTVSCRAKHIELSLRLMEDVDVPRFGEIYIFSQVNDQRAVRQRWIWDDEGIILTYIDDPVALLQSIPDGAQWRLGIGDSKGARHMATYQLSGLDAVRKRVASTCPWPSPSVQASSGTR